MRTLLLTALLAFASPAHASGDTLKVVASFSILGDMVQQVGGGDITLTTLIGRNSNAHAYSPTPSDAATLADADLVIVNGMGFEGWLERLVSSSGYRGVIVAASDGITPIASSDGGKADFHAWQDAANGKRYIANIRDALSAADPAHASAYQRRADAMIRKLDSLDRQIRQQVAAIPQGKRKVVTTHSAFGYYAHAYGITFIAPAGTSNENDTSAGTMARLVDALRSQNVRILFLENITSDRMIQQLQADTGAHIGGTLYSDALSETDGPAPDYITLLKHNTAQLVSGMQHNL